MSLAHTEQRIAAACRAANRDRHEVTLVAVTKNHGVEDIRALIAAGQHTFGENRIQDALEKWTPLKIEFPDIRLHFIGHLQTNKVKDAVTLFDVIETVDSERLAEALAKEMTKQKKGLPCLLQVNTGDEPQKGGVAVDKAADLLKFCQDTAGLDVRGLMCIPPANDIPDLHFALLHKLAFSLNLGQLSMGMSDDFERAIAFGATHVRIGSALFG